MTASQRRCDKAFTDARAGAWIDTDHRARWQRYAAQAPEGDRCAPARFSHGTAPVGLAPSAPSSTSSPMTVTRPPAEAERTASEGAGARPAAAEEQRAGGATGGGAAGGNAAGTPPAKKARKTPPGCGGDKGKGIQDDTSGNGGNDE